MAPLYARLTGDPHRKTTTKTAHESIESRLETWHGCVKTVLNRDGSYEVSIGAKHDPRLVVAEGNVDDRG